MMKSLYFFSKIIFTFVQTPAIVMMDAIANKSKKKRLAAACKKFTDLVSFLKPLSPVYLEGMTS
jgi:hypothetical protein